MLRLQATYCDALVSFPPLFRALPSDCTRLGFRFMPRACSLAPTSSGCCERILRRNVMPCAGIRRGAEEGSMPCVRRDALLCMHLTLARMTEYLPSVYEAWRSQSRLPNGERIAIAPTSSGCLSAIRSRHYAIRLH